MSRSNVGHVNRLKAECEGGTVLAKRKVVVFRVLEARILDDRVQVEIAYKAGAEFIISPDCYEGVIRKTRELGMVSIPGVFTPTDAANAHRYGADFAKLFPNSEAKISYLKALAVPLSHIKFLAVGGVNAENMKDYFAAGAKGIGVATAIADKTAIFNGDYAEVTRRARLFTDQL